MQLLCVCAAVSERNFHILVVFQKCVLKMLVINGLRSSRAEWNVDDDIPVLSRAVREIREEKGPEPILLVFHQAVVESLQRINLVYEKCRNAFLSTV